MTTGKASPLSVKFSYQTQVDETRSRFEGRRATKEAEFVEIRIPGSPDCLRHFVTDRDREEFPVEYEAFKAGRRAPGTPLEAWGELNDEQIAELRHVGINTVEHLAEVSDANSGGISNPRMLRRQAGEWLAKKTASAEAAERAAEARERAENDASLRARVAELERKVSQLTEGR